MNRLELGKKGEDLAACYLQERGCRLLCKNYRCPLGEIDLVMTKDNIIIFVEVKTRTNYNYGMPYESVSYHKIKKLRQVANYFLKENCMTGKNCRFDVVSVLWTSLGHHIEIIENAF
ncbi:MAG: YraN family protein [Bacillota bacterium]